VKAISSRLQVELIAFAYASLLLFAAFEWYIRHLAELRYPIDAQGGMWAFGDEILTYFLFFLFLFPTFFLLRLMAKSERVYNCYARVAFAAAFTAPLGLVLLNADISKIYSAIAEAALMRLFRSPMVWTVLVMSRILARSKQAKRLMNWAVATETLTIVCSIAMLFLAARHHS